MSELPPATAAVRAYLLEATGLPWSTSVPTSRPAEFGIVAATGGPVVNLAQVAPTFTIQLWAATSARAEQLARDAWAALDAAQEYIAPTIPTVWVAAHTLTLPVDYPDSLSGTPRWVFIYNPTINLIQE